MKIIIADKQDITRAGLMYVLDGMALSNRQCVEDKAVLIAVLMKSGHALVILDYTLFNVNGAAELLVLSQRFTHVRWILFSDELSSEFVRSVLVNSNRISIVMKDSSLQELTDAIRYALNDKRFICQHMTEELLVPAPRQEERIPLTPTEIEVLKDIARGMTTREIAEKRFSSFHTINTHRKNIFRKLQVNNIHEAIKYALRAGLVDPAEYYI